MLLDYLALSMMPTPGDTVWRVYFWRGGNFRCCMIPQSQNLPLMKNLMTTWTRMHKPWWACLTAVHNHTTWLVLNTRLLVWAAGIPVPAMGTIAWETFRAAVTKLKPWKLILKTTFDKYYIAPLKITRYTAMAIFEGTDWEKDGSLYPLRMCTG